MKEVYYTLQGEGANTGRPAVFLRFSGCNLACEWCDTDFDGFDGPGGGSYGLADLARAVRHRWPSDSIGFVVCTGGEPMLQLDRFLIAGLHAAQMTVAVETNGLFEVPGTVDWICVSPKPGGELCQRHGDELKLVYPQEHIPPAQYERLRFDHFFLQPMDGPELEKNTAMAIRYCLENPKWRLSIQTQKIVGIA